MDKLGDLKNLPLKVKWNHEGNDFTPWLADNIQILGDALGVEIELIRREADVGEFSLDLLAKDIGTGGHIVIENQYNRTDHDHFGKLLAYAAGYDASIVVWISEEIRDEHRQTLEWLNQRTDNDTQFFGIIAELLQIDDSKLAFNLRIVESPNEWQKNTRRNVERVITPKGEKYRGFFQPLMDSLRKKYKFTGARKAQPNHWYYFASGTSGLKFELSFAKDRTVRVGLYIDHGDMESNKQLFDWLRESCSQIQADYEAELQWERLNDRRASRIAVYREGSIEDDEDTLSEISAWAIENLIKFKKVFKPYLKECIGQGNPE